MSWLEDLRYARRLFARRIRFTILLVATITLGAGAATAIFSLVDGVLWRPLPYHGADRLYWIAHTDSSWRESPVLASVWDNMGHTLPTYWSWATTQRSFDATAAWVAATAVLSTRSGAEEVPAGRATASFAPMLGATPVLGRWFLPGEDGRGAPRLAVLSHRAWQSRFGGDSTVLGSAIQLDRQPYEVIGVLPPDFRLAGDTVGVAVWTPAGSASHDWTTNNFNFRVIGRLAPGVSIESATQEAERLLVIPRAGMRPGIRLRNLQIETTHSARAPLTLLLAAALVLLTVACGNIATLMVAETAARELELSTRLALGASPGRLARQLLTEGTVLSVLGAGSGWLLAAALVRVLRALAPAGIPRIASAQLDGRAVLFAVGVCAVTVLACTLAPLAGLTRIAPAVPMAAGSSRHTADRRLLERTGLFVQSALAVVLLSAAALLVTTHRRLVAVDLGFSADRVLSARLRFRSFPRTAAEYDAQRNVLEQVARRAVTLPGVVSTTFAFAVPFQWLSTTTVNVAASRIVSDTAAIAGTYAIAGPRFFETLGIPLRAGRRFDERDEAPGAVAIVSESFARQFWPDGPAVGQRIRVDDQWRDIVGVVADVRHQRVDEAVRATFYLPAAQAGARLPDAVVLRTSGDPRALVGSVRRLIAAQDPGMAIASADRLSDRVDATLVGERFRTVLLAVFAATAVLLAAVGIVGVATHAATRRRRELAVRMAVGATPGVAMRLLITSTLAAVAAGMVTGLVVALGAGRALRPFVYGVVPGDPRIHAAVAGLIGLTSLLAAWVPARRVARLDLMRTIEGA